MRMLLVTVIVGVIAFVAGVAVGIYYANKALMAQIGARFW